MKVRTIRTHRLREELVCNTIADKIDALGIQEHRLLHTEDIKYEMVNGRTLIISSAWRNDSGAATGGVGILLNSKAGKALSNVIKFNERVIIVNLDGNPATTIILLINSSKWFNFCAIGLYLFQIFVIYVENNIHVEIAYK